MTCGGRNVSTLRNNHIANHKVGIESRCQKKKGSENGPSNF